MATVTSPIDTVLEVDTPEHLAFKVRIAGPARRAMAWLVDLLIRTGLLVTLTLGLMAIFGSIEASGIGVGLGLLGMFVFTLISGFIGGAIYALIYNLVAGMVGGVIVELEDA